MTLTRMAWTGACVALLTLGCGTSSDVGGVDPADDVAAVELWAFPHTEGIRVYAPEDLKASSRDVAWGIDGIAAGIIRYAGDSGESGVFGFLDNPPAEVADPARLAVAENTGIFVFDDSTGTVDLYTPGGQHLRRFDPGLRPSVLEVSRRPLRLTYGVRTFNDDSIPSLSVIQSDFLGRNMDTLLSPRTGPESIRDLPAVRGRLVTTPSVSGLWVFAPAISDTVFEVSSQLPARKLVLPEADSTRIGVLADLQQDILWVVAPRPTGTLDLEAYDLGDGGEIIDGSRAYLGARTVPIELIPTSAHDGAVIGWFRSEKGVHAPRAYDMQVEDLRRDADDARLARPARRSLLAAEWQKVLQALQEAREQQERERAGEAIRAEEAQQ